MFLVNKQVNDKERIAAAMENPNLREIVETCIKDEDWKCLLNFEMIVFYAKLRIDYFVNALTYVTLNYV